MANCTRMNLTTVFIIKLLLKIVLSIEGSIYDNCFILTSNDIANIKEITKQQDGSIFFF